MELKELKCIVALKTASGDESVKRHRARLIIASHKSALRHSVNCNNSVVMLRTVRMLACILPKWMKLICLLPNNDKIFIFCRDVTKEEED